MAANQSMPHSLDAMSLDAHSVTKMSLSPTGEGAGRNTRRRVWSPTRTARFRFIRNSLTAATIAMAATVLAADSFPVSIRVDAAKPKGGLKPIWRFCGADEPNYAYPPKDYQKWADLVFQWTKHCLEKYGRAEVQSWYWEVWNEANIGYWRGTPEEFRKLHDYAIDAVRRALPTAKVGGPDTAGSGGRFTREFLEHCLRGTNYATGKVGTPLDFISFHAKGAPVTTNGHVRMGIANQLQTIEEGFRIVASYPELKNTPVVIGECDPEGCAACQGPQLAYRNGTMYSSYTAASFARIHDLAERHCVNVEGALTWAFEFEDQPYFAGFRSLASNGIDKPVLNVFRMFAKIRGQRLAVESDNAVPLEEIVRRGAGAKPDVSALPGLEGNKLCVLVW